MEWKKLYEKKETRKTDIRAIYLLPVDSQTLGVI